ncbi:DUF308 domain-containing protein [Methanobrevibacter curvatus]|uniref:Acid-resistance membrane protein n=1 Tax=Methanobrevibacter curvatus TaxID=49547 RepID=A0A166BDR6_9EURY|nr:DUF308 domain-containing protein [Methanobrevibacter curvatus]KZX13196.1 hypothetical protein MBCUR_07230 [Methanobrevibacter curvatus]
MKRGIISILTIFLGILIICLPLFGINSAYSIIGLSILLLGIFLLISGIAEIDYSPTRSIISIILGSIMLVLSLGFIFNLNLFGIISEITLFLGGIFLMVIGLITLIGNKNNKYGFWIGIIGVLIGILYILIGLLFPKPLFLGFLVGLWLFICGALRLVDRV